MPQLLSAIMCSADSKQPSDIGTDVPALKLFDGAAPPAGTQAFGSNLLSALQDASKRTPASTLQVDTYIIVWTLPRLVQLSTPPQVADTS